MHMTFEKPRKATASFIEPILPEREEPQGYLLSWNKTEKSTIDANGNLLNDGEKSYEWDAENRLI